MAAPESLIREFCEEATCPVCWEYFLDPVITECGHSFCKACLAKSWGEPERPPSCPQCRQPVQKNSVRPNWKLAKVAEISRRSNLHVVCETHQEPLTLFCKTDKIPICVVCKKSEEHKDHPVISLAEAAKEFKNKGMCVKHQKPLKLFCRDDDVPLCVLCDPEHGKHQVIPVEEAAEDYQKKVHHLLQLLEKKREKVEKQKESEQQESQDCLKQLEEESQKIASFFKEMRSFLEEKEHFWLSGMGDLEKEARKRLEENLNRLSKETLYFSDLIRDMEGKCLQPPGSFLQDIKDVLNRGPERQPLMLPSGLGWRFKKDSLNTSILKEVTEEFTGALEEFKGSLMGELNAVSVTLDPDTANRYLVLPADLKSVTGRDFGQDLPNNPERFTPMACVLGRERFSSGKHYWGVEVQPLLFAGEEWAVGVARETVRRKEIMSFSPNNGIWAVGKEKATCALWAYTSPKHTLLNSGNRPLRKMWVFLDCKHGLVEFVDADTGNLIFSFPQTSFSGEVIRPFFWIPTAGIRFKC